jgi:hypothetical protein
MTAPPNCPQDQNFEVLTEFLTPGSDAGSGTLDASISADVLDPTEGNERVRAVEITAPGRSKSIGSSAVACRHRRRLLARSGLH